MKKILFKKMAAVTASAVIAVSMVITANAEENNADTTVNTDTSAAEKVGKYTKDELHEMLFELSWEDSEVGEENPLASLEYKWIGEWLDKYYGKSQLSAALPDKDFIPAHWDRDGEITDAWTNYRFEIMQTFDSDEDIDGNYYMQSYDPETGDKLERYDFNFNEDSGMWELIDKDGNVYDSFEPHGGEGVPSHEDIENHVDEFLKESGERQRSDGETADETEDTVDDTSSIIEYAEPEELTQDNESLTAEEVPADYTDGGDTNITDTTDKTEPETTGETAPETNSVSTEQTDEKSIAEPVIIGGAAVIAAVGAFFIVRKRKKK